MLASESSFTRTENADEAGNLRVGVLLRVSDSSLVDSQLGCCHVVALRQTIVADRHGDAGPDRSVQWPD